MKNNIFSDAFRTLANTVVELPEEKNEEEEAPVAPAASARQPGKAATFEELAQRNRQREQSAFDREVEAEAAAASAAQSVPPPVPATPAPKPVIADGTGKVDYAALYKVANIAPTPMPAEKCLEFIASLPEGLPQEVKRQTVRISVQTMGGALGATPQTIVSDARSKSEAIGQFVEANDNDTAQYIQVAENQIRDLEAKIAALKSGISSAQTRQENIHESCLAETNRLKEVVGFFVES